MMHVMGKRPLTYIHMTNANIVPMLSFGTVNLDWEWRDQGPFADLDVQDRQGPDLILAQSLGLQSGNLPVAITGCMLHGRDWLTRTLMATCFPHEIRIHSGSGDVAFAQTQMARFGYGQPDCRVFRFWEDGFPLKIEGAAMRGLVLARDGKGLIALGNFGPAAAADPTAAESSAAAPTLEEYDAVQRGRQPSPEPSRAAAQAPATPARYKVRLRLDLEALGLSEDVRARDLETLWFRPRARSPHAGDAPVAIRQPERIGPGVFEFERGHPPGGGRLVSGGRQDLLGGDRRRRHVHVAGHRRYGVLAGRRAAAVGEVSRRRARRRQLGGLDDRRPQRGRHRRVRV
jgi:hypothetical protein